MAEDRTIHTQSGRTLGELSIEALAAGELAPEDFRISRETLDHQAAAAEQAGYHQLAENLRRAAEMTGLSQQQIFEIYDMLRPGRATYDDLIRLAAGLEQEQHMPLVAAFIREAADAYRERGIAKP
jgi:propanediol dehydratase small subunit